MRPLSGRMRKCVSVFEGVDQNNPREGSETARERRVSRAAAPSAPAPSNVEKGAAVMNSV